MRLQALCCIAVYFVLFSCRASTSGLRQANQDLSSERLAISEQCWSSTPANSEFPLAADTDIFIDAIFIAQTHLLEPHSPYFRLTSERSALLKMNVRTTAPGTKAPPITVELELNRHRLPLAINSPKILPTRFAPGQHNLDDSYTAMIPKEWIKPNLNLHIRIANVSKSYTPLNVGAPNPLMIKLLTFNVFKRESLAYSALWPDEFWAKMPISRLDIKTIEPWFFPEIVVVPRSDVKLPAYRIKNPQEYRTKSGQGFDGEQSTTLSWLNAIQNASGEKRLMVYYGGLAGVGVGGGLTDPFTAMGRAGHDGIFFHEIGHAVGLPHWCDNKDYPYRGKMCGIESPVFRCDQGDRGSPADPQPYQVHVGPTWGVDLREETASVTGYRSPHLIPPTIQATAKLQQTCEQAGRFKKDPMCGGGDGDQEPGFIYRMFSDYSVSRMRSYIERELVIYDPNLQRYTKWDEATKSYQPVAESDVRYPVVRDASIYTLLVTASPVTPEANFIYPPLGPYQAGLIKTFDPSKLDDRQMTLRTDGYCVNACDFTLRVLQGGKVSYYILRGSWKPNANPVQKEALQTMALNLPASNGAIEEVTLLLTPEVAHIGLDESGRDHSGQSPHVLYHMSLRQGE